MEKLRFELTDVIEGKFEHISRNLESDTRQLRATYEELSNDLQATNRGLLASFKEKVTTIRTMAATFFAKTEAACDANIKRVKDIEQAFEHFSANFVNPSKEVDGKIYGMTLRI